MLEDDGVRIDPKFTGLNAKFLMQPASDLRLDFGTAEEGFQPIFASSLHFRSRSYSTTVHAGTFMGISLSFPAQTLKSIRRPAAPPLPTNGSTDMLGAQLRRFLGESLVFGLKSQDLRTEFAQKAIELACVSRPHLWSPISPWVMAAKDAHAVKITAKIKVIIPNAHQLIGDSVLSLANSVCLANSLRCARSSINQDPFCMSVLHCSVAPVLHFWGTPNSWNSGRN